MTADVSHSRLVEHDGAAIGLLAAAVRDTTYAAATRTALCDIVVTVGERGR